MSKWFTLIHSSNYWMLVAYWLLYIKKRNNNQERERELQHLHMHVQFSPELSLRSLKDWTEAKNNSEVAVPHKSSIKQRWCALQHQNCSQRLDVTRSLIHPLCPKCWVGSPHGQLVERLYNSWDFSKHPRRTSATGIWDHDLRHSGKNTFIVKPKPKMRTCSIGLKRRCSLQSMAACSWDTSCAHVSCVSCAFCPSCASSPYIEHQQPPLNGLGWPSKGRAFLSFFNFFSWGKHG